MHMFVIHRKKGFINRFFINENGSCLYEQEYVALGHVRLNFTGITVAFNWAQNLERKGEKKSVFAHQAYVFLFITMAQML